MKLSKIKKPHIVMFLTLINICSTLLYAFLEDPTTNSFSMTGSRYSLINNIHFLVWAMIFFVCTYYIIRQIIILNDNSKWRFKLLLYNSILLVLITIIPARLEMPVLRCIHIGLSGVHVIIFAYVFHPYVNQVFKNSLMRIAVIIWMIMIWIGGVVFYFVFGHNSIYQLWYFINLSLFISVTYFNAFINYLESQNNADKFWVYDRQVIHIVLLLIINIIVTFIYSTIKDPFQYTLSMIGALFEPIYILFFVMWGLFFSISINFIFLTLFRIYNYQSKYKRWTFQVSLLTLVTITLIPVTSAFPILRYTHIFLSGVYVIFFTLGFHHFIHHVTREMTRTRYFYSVWIVLIWLGTIFMFLYYGNTGIYELWFLFSVPLLLITVTIQTYLSKRKAV